MALTVSRLGMSLIRMGGASESVRFLDDVDLTFSLDSRSSSSHQMTNIEIGAKPITFRASYRDINLIMSIINKAIEGYGNSQQSPTQHNEDVLKSNSSQKPEMGVIKATTVNQSFQDGKAQVLVSKEQVFVEQELTIIFFLIIFTVEGII
jgi:vacuolar protein sorting-associated protein 13A/C